MARLVVENRHQKDTCYDDIGLCAQHIDTDMWVSFSLLFKREERIFTLTSQFFDLASLALNTKLETIVCVIHCNLMNIYDNIGCNPTVKDVELEVPLPHHHNRLQTLPNDYKSCKILPVLENGKKISPQPSHNTHNYSPSNKVEMMGGKKLRNPQNTREVSLFAVSPLPPPNVNNYKYHDTPTPAFTEVQTINITFLQEPYAQNFSSKLQVNSHSLEGVVKSVWETIDIHGLGDTMFFWVLKTLPRQLDSSSPHLLRAAW